MPASGGWPITPQSSLFTPAWNSLGKRHGVASAGIAAGCIPQLTAISAGGIYDKATHDVYISAPTLKTMQGTLNTLIHELAHHTSQAEDGEEAHNSALSNVGADVVIEIASGKYDEHIRKVDLW